MAIEAIPPILSEYDEVFNTMQRQLDLYRSEHEIIRQEVLQLLKDNEDLRNNIKSDFRKKLETGLNDKIENIARSEMVINLRQQLELSLTERKQLSDITKTSQNLIQNLERKLRESQSDKAGDMNSNMDHHSISVLQSKIEELSLEVKLERSTRDDEEALRLKVQTEAAKLRVLLDDKEASLKDLDVKNRELESRCFTLEQECTLVGATLQCVTKSRDSLEATLLEKEKIIGNLKNRNSEASCKVEEAIEVSERAVLERDQALCREVQLQTEITRLRQSMDHVIEEAAKKVNNQIIKTKENGNEQIFKLQQDCKKLEGSILVKTAQLQKLTNDYNELQAAVKAKIVHESTAELAELRATVTFTQEQLKSTQSALKEVLDENDRLIDNIEAATAQEHDMREIVLDLKTELRNCRCNRLKEKIKELKESKQKQVLELERQIKIQLALNEKWEKETERLLFTLETITKEKAAVSEKLRAKNKVLTEKLKKCFSENNKLRCNCANERDNSE